MDDRRSKFESLPEERREAIVSAAVETFGKNDYKNASTETIARRAGISKGLLFFYFKNKKELYLYLMEHLMEKVSDLVLDNCGCLGDGSLDVPGVMEKVGPTSTAVGAAMLNAMMAQAVELIAAAGGVVPVFVSANLEGGDEHNKNMLAKYKDHIFYMGDI